MPFLNEKGLARFFAGLKTKFVTKKDIPLFATTDEAVAGTVTDKVMSPATVKAAIKNNAALPIGFEYLQMNPNIPEGSLPMLGGEYSRSLYADLWAWVQTQTGYLVTETEWQALFTSNEGNVPKYSSGNGTTTFRVPSLKCWIKGASGIEEVGSYYSDAIRNITGSIGYPTTEYGRAGTGAFSCTLVQSGGMGSDGKGSSPVRYDMDVSKVVPTAEENRPKSLVGLYLVKAYGTVSLGGTVSEENILNNITDMNANVSNLNSSINNSLNSHATAIAKLQNCILGTPTMTLLAGGTSTSNFIGSGTITFSQSWRKFDALLFYVTGDTSNDGSSPIMLYKWQIEHGLNYHKTRGTGFLIPMGGFNGYWEINAATSTDTQWINKRENCGVSAIYGVKFEATGITNNSAVDVSEIQSKISTMLTTDNHLVLSSGLEIW